MGAAQPTKQHYDSHCMPHTACFTPATGGYDPTKPATPLALASMTKWLQARQDGVTAARKAYRSKMPAGAASAAAGNVYFSAEVNLVQESRTTGAPNMINKVIPHVATKATNATSATNAPTHPTQPTLPTHPTQPARLRLRPAPLSVMLTYTLP